jgi:uncharacterized RDD family membrane protein YckC
MGNLSYAGFWLRFVALLIDGFILSVVNWTLGRIFGTGSESILNTLISWLYFSLMESSEKQATLGKLAMGIKVTDLNGERISFGRATGRFFAKIISGFILLIGYFMAGWTEKKQALHDMIASCLVVRK